MKKVLCIVIMAISLLSCTTKGMYHIKGSVQSDSLEGVKIYLVPLHTQNGEDVDSTTIVNKSFQFKGNQEWMAAIRVALDYREGFESLLVVTEPGEINVSIGSTSNGGGTPQNDSLQVWKELVKTDQNNYRKFGMSGEIEKRDSVHNAHKERTRQMAYNLGAESTLGKFLLKTYPPEN